MSRASFTYRAQLSTRAMLIDSFNKRSSSEVNSILNTSMKGIINNQLKDLRDKYNQYLDSYVSLSNLQDIFYNDNDILDQLKQVLKNETTGNNLLTLLQEKSLIQNKSFIQDEIARYDETYQSFYKSVTKSIDLIENTTSSLRKETILGHIGVLDNNNVFKEFSLDQESLNKFRNDQNIFKLNVTIDKKNNYLVSLKTKENINDSLVYDALQKSVSYQQANSRYGVGELTNAINQRIFSNYQDADIYSQRKNGTLGSRTIGLGRKYEAFDRGMILEDPFGYLNKIKDKGYILDRLPWVAGGDNTYISDTGQQYNISNKFFNFQNQNNNKKYIAGQINISSLKTITDTLDILRTPEKITSRAMNYYEHNLYKMNEQELFNELIYLDNSNLLFDDDKDTAEEYINEQIDEQVNDEVDEQVDQILGPLSDFMD